MGSGSRYFVSLESFLKLAGVLNLHELQYRLRSQSMFFALGMGVFVG